MRGVALVSFLLASGLFSGCAAPEEPAAVPTVPQPMIKDELVEWTAAMASAFCTTTGVQACVGGLVGSNGSDPAPTYVHDAEGRDLAGGTLTLDWEPAMPTTENLRVVVFALSGCPDDCETNRSLASEIGPSPLTVYLPAMSAGAGLAIAVRVEIVAFAQGTQASLGQDVHLSGLLKFRESPVPVVAAAKGPGNEDHGRR